MSDGHHIPGKHNRTNIATRGLYPEQLEHWESWRSDRTWLHEEINCSKIQNHTRLDTTLKIYRAFKHYVVSIKITRLNSPITANYRITAWIQKFALNSQTSPKLTDPLKVIELNNACKIIIKVIQNSAFESEIHALKNNKPLSRIMGNSPPSRVNPCRAFKRAGVAFDRPITTKCAHKRKPINSKSYIYLFICMCIKAAQTELVSNLPTDLHDLTALTKAHVLMGEPLIQLFHVDMFFNRILSFSCRWKLIIQARYKF